MFMIYMGGFAAVSMILVAMVRQFLDGYANFTNRAVIYGLVLSILTGGVAFGVSLLSADPFVVYWLTSVVFLLGGIVQSTLIHRKFFLAREENLKRVFIGELLFCLAEMLFTVVIFAAAWYYLWSREFMFYPMLLSALFFMVPILFLRMFTEAAGIPAAQFDTWKYPVNSPIEPPDDNGNERLVVMGFEIAKNLDDKQKTFFRARAPEEIGLGELFYHFINDYNELQSETPIQYINKQHDVVEWWFRLKKKWYQREQILDPGLTVKENKVTENTVIICERITNN
jgi:hypothetical protein